MKMTRTSLTTFMHCRDRLPRDGKRPRGGSIGKLGQPGKSKGLTQRTAATVETCTTSVAEFAKDLDRFVIRRTWWSLVDQTKHVPLVRKTNDSAQCIALPRETYTRQNTMASFPFIAKWLRLAVFTTFYGPLVGKLEGDP